MAVDAALGAIGAGALTGAALGTAGAAFNNNNAYGQAALNGASIGVGVVTLGGLVVAVFSEKSRETGLEAAGIGLGISVIGALLSGVGSSKSATKT